MTAVVFSVVTLEAFINELGANAELRDWSDERIQCFADLMRELENTQARLQVKYHLAYFALTGRNCPKGTQPFQDFATLVNLRNQLIHYRAQRTAYNADTMRVLYDPPKLVTVLANRELIPKPKPHGDMAFMSRVGTPQVAVWAFNTAVKMIGALHNAIPQGAFREMELSIKHPDEIDSGSVGEPKRGKGAARVTTAKAKSKVKRKKAPKTVTRKRRSR